MRRNDDADALAVFEELPGLEKAARVSPDHCLREVASLRHGLGKVEALKAAASRRAEAGDDDAAACAAACGGFLELAGAAAAGLEQDVAAAARAFSETIA